MAQDGTGRNVRAGIFVAAAMILLVALVVILGRSQSLFSSKARLHCEFDNTSGLVVGAEVRLAGVHIGAVQAVRFADDLRHKRVQVTLGVDSRYLPRIREDSVAQLDSKGLLGDTLINITVGGADEKQLADGATLRSRESTDLGRVVASVEEGVGEVRGLAGHLDRTLGEVFTPGLARDVGRIAHSAGDVLERVESGPGLTHALVYEPELSRSAGRLLDDAGATVRRADKAIGRIDDLLAAVEHQDGTAHALIYGDDGKRLLGEARGAIRDIDALVVEVQRGKGLVHSLVYEEDRGNLAENLTAMSRTLRQLTDDAAEGKGTLGALLRDPTVYEDLKTILGNVKRSALLRALVRYTIHQDGLGAPAAPKPK